jgi:putative nucleotidyltransferase with HDIG domain
MKDALLFIDDEPHILSAIERIFADHEVRIFTATSPLAGLELLGREEIAVMVTDNMMPGMNGLEVLRRAREISPDTVRIMLTGHADLDTAVAAINIGEVFRFIVKPWDNLAFAEIIQESLQRYRIVKELRSGDEAVMLSIARTIELKDSYTRGHCDRVAEYAVMLAEEVGLSAQARKEIRHGSWLHDCGKIGVAESVLNSPAALNQDEYSLVKKHCLWGAEVARLAHLPERVVNIILYHHERYDGTGYPSGLKGSSIPLEARIVSIGDVYDTLTTERPYRKALPREEGLRIISSVSGDQLDATLVETFRYRLLTGRGLMPTSSE